MWLGVPWITVLSRGEGALAPTCRASKGYYQIWEINARLFKLWVFWFCFGDPFWAFMNWFWFGLGTGRIKAILIFNHNPVGSFLSALIHFHLVFNPNMRVTILFDLYSWCSCSPILIFICHLNPNMKIKSGFWSFFFYPYPNIVKKKSSRTWQQYSSTFIMRSFLRRTR